jgi:hypothetical protein
MLLLDEPVAGMNREETEDMARFILEVRRDWGITVLMVEHDMGMVMDLSDHVVVLNFGQVIAQGTAGTRCRPTPKSFGVPGLGRPGATARSASRRIVRLQRRRMPHDRLVAAVRDRLAGLGRRAVCADRAGLRHHLQGHPRGQHRHRRDADGGRLPVLLVQRRPAAGRSGWPIPAAMLASGVFGAVVERTMIRPMLGESPIASFMVTVGLGSILVGAGRD